MARDVVVIGAGIIGLATADALLRARPDLRVTILEKEEAPAAHQSGRNSGVIHSGLYYRPGSLKARTVAAGRRALLELCEEHDVAHRVVGKVIVAVEEAERPGLRELKARADRNGVAARLVGREGLAELEPHARGIEAIHVPGAAIVDFADVCRCLARRVTDGGGVLEVGRRVRSIDERATEAVARTDGQDIAARVAVNCAGLHSDLLAAGGGSRRDAAVRIVPFRGEYHQVTAGRRHLVRSMIYPVPDPRFPFLGAHFTRTVDGGLHAGPNAVLALAREGYSWRVVDPAEIWELLRFRGFRRMVARYWRTGLSELRRSLFRSALVANLRRLVPEISAADLERAPAGVRAQAVDRHGGLVDDFVLHESTRTVHVLNAPSPAATASLEIGRLVAARALARLG